MKIIERFSLKGKVALLTGAAGLYGTQILRALAEAGAIICIASRNKEALEKVAQSHRAEGCEIHTFTLDQSDEKSILKLKEEIKEKFTSIHILVNNAVARPATKGYLYATASEIEKSMAVNATGIILLTRAIGEILHDNGSIINIGSMMGLVGLEPLNYQGTKMDGWSADYFFHKGGMANLTRFLASFYGPRGIRVNCIHPGGLAQPTQPKQFQINYSERTCLGRLANDTDLMGIVVFLASDASLYITGTNIPVDGGYTAK
jgi:NAD(P)-dependent dehydrogenase (short-subunit alcohol dehydrogenase family)